MDLALTILMDGLIYASWLFVVALGLTLVFGVLKNLTKKTQPELELIS